MARFMYHAFGRFYSGCLTILHQNSPRRFLQLNLSSGLYYSGDKRPSERGRATNAHLRLACAGQQCSNMMPEAAAAQVDLSQTIEEQKASSYNRVLEFAQDEFERGKRTDLHQQPPLGALPQ